MIAPLLPPGVVALRGTHAMADEPLHPAEAACLDPAAVPQRRREFAVGRACARAALAALGVQGFPLLRGQDRAPVWPEGIVGSVTHCPGFVGAAVARREPVVGLGIDAEPAAILPERIIPRVCTAGEVAWVRRAAPPRLGDWFRLIFSAKESIYKCWYGATRLHLSFHDVELALEPGTREFRFGAASRTSVGPMVFTGRFGMDDHHFVTAAALSRPHASPDAGAEGSGGP